MLNNVSMSLLHNRASYFGISFITLAEKRSTIVCFICVCAEKLLNSWHDSSGVLGGYSKKSKGKKSLKAQQGEIKYTNALLIYAMAQYLHWHTYLADKWLQQWWQPEATVSPVPWPSVTLLHTSPNLKRKITHTDYSSSEYCCTVHRSPRCTSTSLTSPSDECNPPTPRVNINSLANNCTAFQMLLGL